MIAAFGESEQCVNNRLATVIQNFLELEFNNQVLPRTAALFGLVVSVSEAASEVYWAMVSAMYEVQFGKSRMQLSN